MNCINTVADQTEASNGGVQLARDRRLEMRRIRMAAGGRRPPAVRVTPAIQSIFLMPEKTQPPELNSTLGVGTDCPIPAEPAHAQVNTNCAQCQPDQLGG